MGPKDKGMGYWPLIHSKDEIGKYVMIVQGSNAVATATLLVLCGRSVPEVLSVITCLLWSSYKKAEVMEMFYCLATLCLYGCHEMKKFPMRWGFTLTALLEHCTIYFIMHAYYFITIHMENYLEALVFHLIQHFRSSFWIHYNIATWYAQ